MDNCIFYRNIINVAPPLWTSIMAVLTIQKENVQPPQNYNPRLWKFFFSCCATTTVEYLEIIEVHNINPRLEEKELAKPPARFKLTTSRGLLYRCAATADKIILQTIFILGIELGFKQWAVLALWSMQRWTLSSAMKYRSAFFSDPKNANLAFH